MLLATVIALAVGIVVGWAIARLRAQADTQAEAVDGRPAAASSTADPPQVASIIQEAMDHLEIGVVVSAPNGAITYRNGAATARDGTHAGLVIEEHVRALLASARSGDRGSRVVELHGPPKAAFAIESEPMPDGAAVATIQDVSERMRIDTMRTDFVANISHELRTPVGALAVLAEALVDESDPAIVERVASRMVTEAHRAVKTIDDLLELSRIESSRLADEVVEVDELIRAAIARGNVAVGDRGVAVRAVGGPARLRLRADRRQLVSALGNLVENAVKYSHDDGEVEVRVGVDTDVVEIAVADHGVGIPSRDIHRVFERFYRVDKGRSRDTGGTGLGLAIVRHVATNHGGAVVVTSEEGVGSTFSLRLPAQLVVTESDEPEDDGMSDDEMSEERSA